MVDFVGLEPVEFGIPIAQLNLNDGTVASITKSDFRDISFGSGRTTVLTLTELSLYAPYQKTGLEIELTFENVTELTLVMGELLPESCRQVGDLWIERTDRGDARFILDELGNYEFNCVSNRLRVVRQQVRECPGQCPAHQSQTTL